MFRPRSLLICGLAAVGLAACGSSSSTSSTATTTPAATSPAPAATTTTPTSRTPPATAGSTVALAADPTGQLAYVQKSLTAKAGKVTIEFTNTSPVPHDVAVASGSKQLGVTPLFSGGGTKSLSLTLAKGTYSFYCTVPGHRQQGMEGTLTVS